MTELYAYCAHVGPFSRCDSGPDWWLALVLLAIVAAVVAVAAALHGD